MTNLATIEKVSIKKQTVAALLAVVAAVALPQLFHVMGYLSGLGTTLGEIFLPMHLPILFIGLLAGPYAGAIAGACSPLVSFALTGMPGSAMLPFMMLELCTYGVCSGLLRTAKMPCIGKVLIAQVSGRAVRAVALLLAVFVFHTTKLPISIIWNSIVVGIFGLVLQWTFIPLIMYRLNQNGSMTGRA